MTKKYVILMIVVFSFSVLQMNCKKEPPIVPQIDPPVYKQSIFLSVTDSGLTEVYLSLSMTDTLPPRGFEIFRNNNKILSGSLFGKETTLVDTTTQINTNYFYQAFRLEDVTRKDSSNIITTSTLDTTSHEFIFEIDTLGDGASQLYDVAIINDTLIYAVGQIYLKDSADNWINPPYNLAKWDGKKWELKQLYYGNNSIISSIRGILPLSMNEIYFAAGGVFKWNTSSDQVQLIFSRLSLPDPNATVEKLWCADKKVYGVGYAGTIVHFNGTTWQKIESGTTVSINDVWGGKDESGTEVVFAGASDLQLQGEMKLLKISPTQQVQNLDWSPQRRINTVWFWTIRKIYVGGSGLYEGVPGNWKIIDISNSFVRRIRGTSSNNVWAVGDFGLCGHFNGSTWKVFPEAYLSDGSYYGLSVNKNNVIAVGQSGNKAIVLRGRKTIN